MTNQKKILADLKFALEKQAYSGHVSLCELLDEEESNWEYWRDLAAELHRMDRHFDALDCWRQSEKRILFLDDIDQWYVAELYRDMIASLSSQWLKQEDRFLAHEAFLAASRFYDRFPNVDTLKLKISIAQFAKRPRGDVLRLVESLFDFQNEIDLELDDYVIGIHNDPIQNLADLADCYLDLDQPCDAFRVFSKLQMDSTDNGKANLCTAIYYLNSYAERLGCNLEDFIPDGIIYELENPREQQ